MVLRKKGNNRLLKICISLLSCAVVKEQVAAGPFPTTLTAETLQE